MSELLKLKVVVALLQMPIQFGHEVAQESFAICPRIGIFNGSGDISPIDLPISVLIKPIKYKVKNGLAAHQTKSRYANNILLEK